MSAASRGAMRDLHAQVASVFKKVLESYERKFDAADQIDMSTLTDEMLAELMTVDLTPNPAMLNAITKFLKDNDIMFDTEEVDALSATEERLKARKERRKDITELGNLKLVADNS